jgi:acetyl-CoA carboxylase biotin carboxylase subunit
MRKILVANRGEIACRIFRTLDKLGIQSVAVYSEADRDAPHVAMAKESICLGAAPSSESYLNQSKIIREALSLGVEGIHPGYGFLSENAEFAESVMDAGMIFIGPGPSSIRVMGSKLEAKAAVKDYNIPMVPGTDVPISDVGDAIKIAKEIGFPILIKASAGGGGKGMRIVESEDQFEENLQRAMSEAQKAFGDSSVFIEKYISSPRHIEIQVLGDQHGNYVHLFERECSIQRRHQKVIEEAPSSILTPTLRAKMGADAIKVAKACQYFSTGTVEFLMDENNQYYFLEMNTRLQVEHPVTEMITGIDLVEMQIRIANGKEIPFSQEEIMLNGHAIELRVYAEDPYDHFLPSIGTLDRYQKPHGIGIRVDDGFEEGMEIPIYYDPMISKLVTYGPSRIEAIQRMIEAIDAYHIKGPKTTLPFGKFVMKSPAFINGDFNTHFVEKYWNSFAQTKVPNEVLKGVANLSAILIEKHRKKLKI